MDIFRKKEPEHVTLLNHGRLPLVAMFTTLVVGIAAGFSLANGVEVQELTAPDAIEVAVFDGIGGPSNRAKLRAARAASPAPTVTVTVTPGVEAVAQAEDPAEQAAATRKAKKPGAKKHAKKTKNAKKTKKHAKGKKEARKGHRSLRKSNGKLIFAMPVEREKLGRVEIYEPHHDYPAWDVGLPYGTKIQSVVPGRVKDVTKRSACGRGVIIKDKRGFTYTYCHGRRVLVHRGVKVGAGRTIMRSGNTGNSTGPHLHLQITNPWGRLICPQKLIASWYEGKARSPRKSNTGGCAYKNRHHERHLMKNARAKAKKLAKR